MGAIVRDRVAHVIPDPVILDLAILGLVILGLVILAPAIHARSGHAITILGHNAPAGSAMV
ncbi:hypothetical protein [Vreelandella zhaodongensis]|uniref:Uncharacterized protein n=1 Tax=Vreelandella zhaodongensis TaxID=1176240 RepID=A0ABX2SNG3_VREZH|nr:hypothetical protein [Halomonas zhaodongensis]NYS43710.1 hypothetical protein [Halomonas zhaodongensis]